jgi:hypothetical protein
MRPIVALVVGSDFEAPKPHRYFKSAHGRLCPQRPPLIIIELIFATTDVAAIILASVIGAVDYQLLLNDAARKLDFHIGTAITGAMMYLLIRRSPGSHQITETLSSSRGAFRICSQWLPDSPALRIAGISFRDWHAVSPQGGRRTGINI